MVWEAHHLNFEIARKADGTLGGTLRADLPQFGAPALAPRATSRATSDVSLGARVAARPGAFLRSSSASVPRVAYTGRV